jgi:hypothetical protein
MFQSKLVFIIGAGASREAGLPVGTELAREIAEKMRIDLDTMGQLEATGDRPLIANVVSHVAPHVQLERYIEAAHRLRDGLPLSQSIDDFLDVHHSDTAMVLLGKSAIVKTILEKEASSRLFFERRRTDSSIPFYDLGDTWLPKLMYMLRHTEPERTFENASFVIFNYDRCLEHFLFYAIRALYALDEQRTREIMSMARIYHPYGFIGDIPEMLRSGRIAFGHTAPMNWAGWSDRIRTFTEEIKTPTILVKIQSEIQDAKALVFLGFGFHRQNMRFLAEPATLQAKKVFASAYGISDSDTQHVIGRISGLFQSHLPVALKSDGYINVKNKLTCAGLLE